MDEKWGKIIGVGVVLAVFCSGLLIFGWNLLQGENLSKPPHFNFQELQEIEDQWTLHPPVEENQTSEVLESSETENISAAAELDAGYIYFKNSFRLQSAVETNQLIVSFLADFEQLKDSQVENLAARNEVEVVVLGGSLEDLIKVLEADERINNVRQDDQLILELNQPMYPKEAQALVNEFEWLELGPDLFPLNLEYVARIKYDSATAEQALEQLKTDYSDLVLVN